MTLSPILHRLRNLALTSHSGTTLKRKTMMHMPSYRTMPHTQKRKDIVCVIRRMTRRCSVKEKI